MQEQILDFLKKKQDYVSGEEISRHLNVSRQALWKHIQELRDAGYDIVAVPHLGYRLVSAPDKLFPFEISSHLNTKIIAKKVYYFDSLSSTMDMGMKLGLEGSPEGTVVLAETQTKGRGRFGRSWHSPKYKGIYMSLILRPKIMPNLCPVLTMLAAVSIVEAIKAKTDLDVQIKWPNDLLIRNKKLGGILTELNAETDETSFIVIGAGLNVNNGKEALVAQSSSLKEEKNEEINRVDLLQEVLRKIEENYVVFKQAGGAPTLEKWRGFNVTLGRRVKVVYHNKHIEGEAVDIDSDGGLLIRRDSGLTEKVMAGDIVHCR
ncbi:MAG: biotin--[acetyl-CoA-carboxylase] ligase [Candidatus Omnitrophica bacterium]|nr:biotin--[acetyl-CoA-carboxylase] ligase [Candidatus Omnitrophota bacterium]